MRGHSQKGIVRADYLPSPRRRGLPISLKFFLTGLKAYVPRLVRGIQLSKAIGLRIAGSCGQAAGRRLNGVKKNLRLIERAGNHSSTWHGAQIMDGSPPARGRHSRYLIAV